MGVALTFLHQGRGWKNGAEDLDKGFSDGYWNAGTVALTWWTRLAERGWAGPADVEGGTRLPGSLSPASAS